MAKMFVYYGKTKAEFIAAGLPTTYNNNIVFIKGDANGNGSCIYTHGTYFANFNDFLAAINYVKGVKVGDSQYNATAGGGYIPFAAADNSTVALNVENGTITVGLTEEFVANALKEEVYIFPVTIEQSATVTQEEYNELRSAIESEKVILVKDEVSNGLLPVVATTTGSASLSYFVSGAERQVIFNVDANPIEIVVETITFATTEDIADAKSDIIGASGDASAANTIYGAKKYADEKASDASELAQSALDKANEVAEDVGNVDDLSTENKEVVKAINEVLAAVGTGGTAAVVTVTEKGATDAYAQVYEIKQGTTTVGTINIPKELVVDAGEIVENPAGQAAGTYIKLTLQNVAEPLYIDVAKLVDVYTAQQNAAQVQLNVDASNVISATIVAGSITSTELAANAVVTAKIADKNVTKDKLSDAVQTSLGKADTAYQMPEGGITVADLDASVNGSLLLANKALQGVSVSGDSYIDVTGTQGETYSEFELTIKTMDIPRDNEIEVIGYGLAKTMDVKSYVDSMWEWEVIS